VKLNKQDIIDAGIRIIGIKGQSCSGKSEAATVIKEHFKNAFAFRVDFYMFNAVVEDDELARQIYGRGKFTDANEALAYWFGIESVEAIRKNGELTKLYVEKMLLKDIASLLKQTYVPNPIIIESFALPLYPKICDLITDMLLIWAPKNVLERNQINREGNSTTAEIRTTALPLNMYTSGKQGKIILNTGSLEDFKTKVKDFCNSIPIESNRIF